MVLNVTITREYANALLFYRFMFRAFIEIGYFKKIHSNQTFSKNSNS